MTNMKTEKYTAGFGLSLIVTSLLNAVILLLKETNEAIMNGMKAALGHHWTTHGVLVIVLFIALGFIFSGTKIAGKWDSRKLLTYIIWAVIIGGAIIAGFFLPHLKGA